MGVMSYPEVLTFLRLCDRGNGASVLRIVPYAAVHFTAYERFRELLLDVVDGFDRGQEVEAARSQQAARQSGSAGQPADNVSPHCIGPPLSASCAPVRLCASNRATRYSAVTFIQLGIQL